MCDLVQIGDIVTLDVAKENREWGYNPGVDGTKVEIVKFGEIDNGRFNCYNGMKPGIYENRCWAYVKFPNGKVEYISTMNLKSHKSFDRMGNKRFIRDLPETPFYEWDKVKPSNGRYDLDKNFATTIGYIHYSDNVRYDVGPGYKAGGWYSMLKAEDIELVERGPVWKFCHNEPLELEGNELFYLYYKLGRYSEVRNPKNKLYLWDKNEILQAAKDNIVDFNTSMFGAITPSAIRYIDCDIGERARKYYIRNSDEIPSR